MIELPTRVVIVVGELLRSTPTSKTLLLRFAAGLTLADGKAWLKLDAADWRAIYEQVMQAGECSEVLRALEAALPATILANGECHD